MTTSNKIGSVGVRPRNVASVCVATLAVLIASAEARASNDTVPSTGWTKTFGNASWASASTKIGDFGAGVTYSSTLTCDSAGNSKTSDNTSDLDLELFGNTFTFIGVDGKASTSSASDGSPSQYLGATVGSYTLLSKVVWKTDTDSQGAGVQLGEVEYGGFKLDLNTTGSYSWTGFSICLEASATKDMWLGPIPLTVTGAVDGCPYLSLDQQNTSSGNGNGQPQLSYKVTPGVDTSFTLSAGLGTSDFSVGVFGSADIVNFSCDMKSSMTLTPSTGAISYTATGTETLSSLSGSVGVYANAGWGIFSVNYQKTLFSWDGITWKSQIIYADSVPTVSAVQAKVSGSTATGSYKYKDSDNAAESGSTYEWDRATDASGTGAAAISGATSKTYTLVNADNNNYLRFCVTPKNSAGNPGTQTCSGWAPVGHVVTIYQDESYSGSSVSWAFERSESSQCYDLSTSFNDAMTSFKFHAPSSYSAKLWFFKDASCSGSTFTVSASAGTQVNSSNVGSTWNDQVSSMMVVWNETASASNVAVAISGNTATAEYDFSDSAGASESGSTFQWYRATSSSGTGTAISGATGSTYTLTPADNGMFLRVCVTPSTGYVTGSQSCSDYSAGVGDLLTLYKDSSYGGSSLSFAYEHSNSQTCFNLTDYSFNDAMTSFKFSNAWAENWGATVAFFWDTNCSGSGLYQTIASGSSSRELDVSSVGSSWNDQASSFLVYWSTPVSITTPVVTISGATATESHTYHDDTGHSEASTYQWYTASSSSGSGRKKISGATSSTHQLTGSENNGYLQVCVTPTNGSVTAAEVCSAYTAVGYEIAFYSEASLTSSSATSVHIAYQQSPSGTCFNLSDFGFDNVPRAFDLFSSTSSAATITYYQAADCVNHNDPNGYFAHGWVTNKNDVVEYSTVTGAKLHSTSGELYSTQLGTYFDMAMSSFKITY